VQTTRRLVILACTFISSSSLAAEAPDKPSDIVLADFEGEPKGWTYVEGF
jgi:hypothetical protein